MPSKRVSLVCVGLILAACGQVDTPPRAPVQPSAPPAARVIGTPTPVPIFRPIGAPTVLSVSTVVPETPTAPFPPTPTPTPEPTSVAVRSMASLGDLWPPAPPTVPTTHGLIYTELVFDAQGSARANVFWRMDMRHPQQRQKLVEISISGMTHMPAYAQLSPDNQFIAYVQGDGDVLHVMRADGTDERQLHGGMGGNNIGCVIPFAWSPDSRHLAFLGGGDVPPYLADVYTYDPQTQISSRLLAQNKTYQILGWRNDATLLMLEHAQRDGIRRVQAINVNEKTRTLVIDLGGPFYAFCVGMSPDRTHVVVGPFVVDVDRQQAVSNIFTPDQGVWNPDDKHIWGWFSSGNNDSRIITVGVARPRYLAVRPDATRSSIMRMQGASPDGQYVVVCESRPNTEWVYTSTTLLYDIWANTWTTIAKGKACGAAVGWLTDT